MAVCGLLIIAGCWLIPDMAISADEGKTANSAIELHRCRIRLIDRVTLASELTGVLDYVEPKEGDRVRSGQNIAGLRDAIPRAAFKVAQRKAENTISRRYAEKAADVAQKEYEKALDANAGSRNRTIIPEIEVERLRLAWEKSKLEIEQAEYQREVDELSRDEAKAQLDAYQVQAPFDGVVTRVFKSRGEAVRQGDPIMELVNNDRVRVEGNVDITDVWSVKPGAAVTVQLEIEDADLPVEREIFQGRIVFVDVAVNPVTKHTLVWAEVDNRNNILREGLTAKMIIHADKDVIAQSRAAGATAP